MSAARPAYCQRALTYCRYGPGPLDEVTAYIVSWSVKENGWAKKLRISNPENKSHYRGAVKVGESGIFRWHDVYSLVMASPPLKLF